VVEAPYEVFDIEPLIASLTVRLSVTPRCRNVAGGISGARESPIESGW